MAVQDDVEALVRERDGGGIGARPEVDAQGREDLPAEPRVGGITLRGGGTLRRMAQGAEELPAPGVIVQQVHVLPQVLPDQAAVIPGQVVFLLEPAPDMGEVPAVNVGLGFFFQPGGPPV